MHVTMTMLKAVTKRNTAVKAPFCEGVFLCPKRCVPHNGNMIGGYENEK